MTTGPAGNRKQGKPVQRYLRMNILRLAAGLALCAAAPALWAQGIYTCTDARGRKITSDRPIIDCIDREQKELNPSGTVRRKLGPSLTVQESAVEEEKQRKRFVASKRHTVEVDFYPYLREIRRERKRAAAPA